MASLCSAQHLREDQPRFPSVALDLSFLVSSVSAISFSLNPPKYRICATQARIRLLHFLQGVARIGISNHQSAPSLPITDSYNQPYVEPKLRSRVVCLANRGAGRLLRRAVGRAGPAACRPLCPSLELGEADPVRLSHPPQNRYSSSSSQQTGLRRRPARHQRQLALGPLRRYGLQVRQYLLRVAHGARDQLPRRRRRHRPLALGH